MKISVFVDGANFFYMQKDDLTWFVDLKKLLQYISKEGEIIDAHYYIGQDAPPAAQHKAFLDALPEMGYSLVTKTIKTIYDPKTGKSKRKANLDIEIVLDMIATIDHYDMAVLVSGDGDFERPLHVLKQKGKRIKVISSEKFLANDLKKFVGPHLVKFEDIRSEVEKIK